MTNDFEYIEAMVQNWINAAKRNSYSTAHRNNTADKFCSILKRLEERVGVELSTRGEFEYCIYSELSEKWELLVRSVLPKLRSEVVVACQKALMALPCPMWSDVMPENFANQILPLFHEGQYLSAIRRGCDMLRATIRAKTGLFELDGSDLVNQAFGKDRPFVFAVWEGHSEDDVRRGYTDMLRGAMMGIRNPYYHGTEEPTEKEAARLLVIVGTLWERAESAVKRSQD
jgi:uncharacterized protein (TIGR02391 family)